MNVEWQRSPIRHNHTANQDSQLSGPRITCTQDLLRSLVCLRLPACRILLNRTSLKSSSTLSSTAATGKTSKGSWASQLLSSSKTPTTTTSRSNVAPILRPRSRGPPSTGPSQPRQLTKTPFDDFDRFVVAVKQAFGVEATGITALRRRALEELKWGRDVPVFFAEFDRLTLQLAQTSHETRILLVREKLPLSLKSELARQALEFHNYR
ncbi:hypothetical protein F5883DRAFT_244653 [Diaporthe sp. PMI_573]|nr:hypothetical protein F5883DRAFT_244653 [Diaporthaceae sp. PMI_573]